MKKSIILSIIAISTLTSFNVQAFDLANSSISVEPPIIIDAQLTLDTTSQCYTVLNAMTLTFKHNASVPFFAENACVRYRDASGTVDPTLAKRNAIQAIQSRVGYACDAYYDFANAKSLYPRGIGHVAVKGNVINKTFSCD
ncbi:MAG: hypothetical protein ACN2B6_08865 [Rickettsiales bacterium]